ncbi:hypothetical protein TKK_0009373 [Trichogramma kaykai]
MTESEGREALRSRSRSRSPASSSSQQQQHQMAMSALGVAGTRRRSTPSPGHVIDMAQRQHQAAAELLRADELQATLKAKAAYEERCCWGFIPKRWFTSQAQGSAKIDVFARFAFPLAFVVFNIAYWSTYMSRGDDNVGHN